MTSISERRSLTCVKVIALIAELQKSALFYVLIYRSLEDTKEV